MASVTRKPNINVTNKIMKRTIIFAAISIALAFVLKKWGAEPCLFNEYICYLVGAMVAVFCFDLGEGESDNKNEKDEQD